MTALILVFFYSCVDVIENNFQENDLSYLIVNAELKSNERRHTVNLLINTREGNDFRANFPVEDAIVYVTIDNETRVDFKHREEGAYVSINLPFENNAQYQLHIDYKNTIYKSLPEIYRPPVKMNFLHTYISTEKIKNAANNIIDENHINLLLDTKFPTEEEVFVKYRLFGTYQYEQVVTPENFDPVTCFVEELIDFDNVSLANNLETTDGELRNHFLFQKKIDYRFAFNYCMSVYQERITKNAYLFWQNVLYEYGRTGDIFEKPPGILRGNVFEEESTDIGVIGLFSMVAVDSSKHLITPLKAGFPQAECSRFGQLATTCLNCLLINKSTLVKPECF